MADIYNNHVKLSDGTTVMDIRDTTAEEEDVAEGKEFYLKSGKKGTGTGNYMRKVSDPTAGDVLVTDENGQAQDSGVPIYSLATKAELNTKQDLLSAGNGIDIKEDEISVDMSVVATKSDLENKQDRLVSGTNIKTVNNESLLEAGNIDIQSEVFVAVYEQTSYADVKAAIDAHKAIVLDMPANNNQFCITFATYTNGGNALMYAIYKMNDKATLMTVTLTPQNQWTISHTDLQEKLISGTNIKTINNIPLLGSGNIDVGREEFIAIIESTSFADVKAAIDANKFIILQETANKTRIPSTTVVSNNSIAFGTTNGNTLSRVTVNNNDVWTVTNIPMSSKQDTLVSGENIKTVNGETILGSGNIDVSGGGSDIFVAEYGVTSYSDVAQAFSENKAFLLIDEFGFKYIGAIVSFDNTTNKYSLAFLSALNAVRVWYVDVSNQWTRTNKKILQPLLESGINIKTINDQSLLGSGNIDIQGGDNVFIAEYGVTSHTDLLEAINNYKTIIIHAWDSYFWCTPVDKGTHICLYTLLTPTRVQECSVSSGTALWKNEQYNLVDTVDFNFSETSINPVQNRTITNKFNDIQSELGTLTDLTTTEKSNLVGAINEVYEKSGEPFRVKQWANSFSVEIPTCTEDISNTAIPKMIFSIDNVEGADYQIVGMIAYEVFDAASGGNRINCWPVCQFTGNGQKELSVRWMCAGTTRKTAKRINAWVLLKHR